MKQSCYSKSHLLWMVFSTLYHFYISLISIFISSRKIWTHEIHNIPINIGTTMYMLNTIRGLLGVVALNFKPWRFKWYIFGRWDLVMVVKVRSRFIGRQGLALGGYFYWPWNSFNIGYGFFSSKLYTLENFRGYD